MSGPDDTVASPSIEDETQRTSLGVGAPTGPKPRDSQVRLQLGSQLGERYRIVAFIGEGGMGAVYRAFDQKLGVDVALKVVREDIADKTLRDEVRLAQKVTHPNVCRTYDLEDVGGHAFVKMEYVAGETLSARLKRTGKLPIAEAIWVARGIAEGLVAAHVQGIVHRDLKPGNVMLSKDRAVLMDFGIARQIETTTGMPTMAGTIGYMAPEQFTNQQFDQRADLYALGCLVYEMLVGEPVFGKGSAVELATRHVAIDAPNVRDKRSDVPRWLARAVAALLAKDPVKRPAGIARLRAGKRSAAWWVAIPIAAVGAAAVVTFALPATHAGAACSASDKPLADVWNPQIRAKVEQAFLATKQPFAAPSFAGVARAMDRYTHAWALGATDACAAHEVRGEQNAAVYAMRKDCLDRRLAELKALSELLVRADAGVVERGDQVVYGLPVIESCANVASLHEPYVPPPEQRERIHEVRKQLTEARVELLAGKYLPSLVAAQKCITTAREVGYEPFVAEAHWIRGSALLATGNIDEASQEYADAVYTAIRSDHGDEAANAAHSAAILAVSRGKAGEAKIWLGMAKAAAMRGGVDKDFERTRLEIEGLIAMESGDLNAGVAEQEKALGLAEQELGKDSPLLYENESTLGTTLAKAGAYRKAQPHVERALAMREASVGPEHPDVASLLTNLGACYTHTHDFAKGKAAFERALAIREKQYGKASPFLIATLDDYGELLRASGDLTAALATQERAMTIAKVVPGVENPMYQQIATDYADTLVAANRTADAKTLLTDVLAVEDKQQSAMAPTTLTSRAEVALADKAWTDAAGFADRAIAGFEAAGGKDNPALWRPLAARAKVELAQKHPDVAKPLLERALAIGEKAAVADEDLAPVKDLLAGLH